MIGKELIRLLGDAEALKVLGQKGKELLEDFSEFNTGLEWNCLFKHIFNEKESDTVLTNADAQIIYRYLNECQNIGKKQIANRLRSELNKTKAQKEEMDTEIEKLRLQVKNLNSENKKLISEKEKLNSKKEKINLEKKNIENSTTFKVGKIVMFIPIKIKLFLKKNCKRLQSGE